MKRSHIGSLVAALALLASPLLAETPATQETDAAPDAPAAVFFENFESEPFLIQHRLLQAAPGEGVDGSTGLRAKYVGEERGSDRIVRRLPLDGELDEATLLYDVRFEEDFQFVRGGKLHGLGPVRPITGGNPIRPDGWSARVTFGPEGRVRTYIYHQDQPGTYGTTRSAADFRFEKGRYHAVSLHVRVNDPDEANGFAHIYVDGELVVEHDELRLRGEGGDDTLINRFLFSTFHGGSSPQWAPTDEEGEYVNVHATFDNFAVFPGKKVRPQPGE